MQYLPGPERSVDCLAHDGELVCCVVRRKPMGIEGGQMLEDNPAIEETVRRLTRHFRLGGVFNIQFRDDAGTPYLLEINPRLSGGLHYACSVRRRVPVLGGALALGRPRPRTCRGRAPASASARSTRPSCYEHAAAIQLNRQASSPCHCAAAR